MRITELSLRITENLEEEGIKDAFARYELYYN